MDTVLYYPYLSPPPVWLRMAALCWDSVYVLSSADSRAYTELPEDIETTIPGFVHFVDVSKIGRNPSLLGIFDEWLRENEERLRTLVEPDSTEERFLFRIFSDKLPGGPFVEQLKQRGLVRFEGYWPDTETDGFQRAPSAGRSPIPSATPPAKKLSRVRAPRTPPGTILLPREAALHYLSLCSAELVTTLGADLFADSQVFASTALAARVRTASLATRLMRLYLPEDLTTVSLDRIRDIRSELRLARTRYQVAVENVIAEMSSISSERDATRLEARVLALASERIDSALATYKRAGATVVLKTLGASLVPGSLSSIASLLGIGLFEPAAITAGLAAIAATYLVEKDSARAAFERDPWSYVGRVAGGLY